MTDRIAWVVFAVSYLWGSLLPARLVIHRATGKSAEELQENPGGGATWRLAGPLGGGLVMFLDIAKGVIPVATVTALALSPAALIAAAVAPVIGHNWPVWKPLRGGRGFATATGVFFALAFVPMFPSYLIGAVAWLFRHWLPLIGVVAWPIGLVSSFYMHLPQPTLTAMVLVVAITLLRQIPWLFTNTETIKRELFSR